MQKYWFIIDDETRARGEIYDNLAAVQTKEGAAREAQIMWERKTKFEQRDCDEFYIGYAEADAECLPSITPDYETMTDIVYIKERKRRS